MVKIAICDDEEIFLNGYMRTINNIKDKYNYNLEVFKFKSGKELLSYININDISFNLIFLDIIMEDKNGIDIAKEIRKIDDKVKIIFLTSSKEYALDSYEVKASNYIIKNSEKMENKIENEVKSLFSSKEYVIVRSKLGVEKVLLKQIVYIESNKRKIRINTIDDKYEIYEKLDNLHQKLKDKGFIKTHKSYIVNAKYIKRIESKDIVTTNGNQIPISRSKVCEVKKGFIEYLEAEMT